MIEIKGSICGVDEISAFLLCSDITFLRKMSFECVRKIFQSTIIVNCVSVSSLTKVVVLSVSPQTVIISTGCFSLSIYVKYFSLSLIDSYDIL